MAATDASSPAPPLPSGANDSPGSIFIRFLKFGCLAWGGPAAQIAMIKEECVDREGWIDETAFKKLLAVYQVLPGPEAHELCVYFGRLRGGRLGGLLAGLGFMLPGFVLMLGLSILYVEADIAKNLHALFYGLTAAVGALVARALVRLSRSFIADVPLATIAVAGFALTLWVGLTFVAVLLGGGIAYELWKNGRRWAHRGNTISIGPPALLAVAAGAITLSLTAAILLEGLKAGLLTFGGAYTVIPFLHDGAVEGHRWLTASQFNDGLAIGGILPAPLIIFSTFVGYVAGGLAGALAMTLGIFLPAFIFPIFLHRQLVAVAENESLHPFLLGVAAAVIGLIAAVTVTILETSVTDVYTALIALGAFAALNRWHSKLTVVYVMAAAGVVGVVLQHTVV
ncbi:MAG: chrA [Solirubrobacterales bacterium]|nr:chrA [Solirubrobacterales bacterium]